MYYPYKNDVFMHQLMHKHVETSVMSSGGEFTNDFTDTLLANLLMRFYLNTFADVLPYTNGFTTTFPVWTIFPTICLRFYYDFELLDRLV
jgi:hypothetical protein